MRATSTHPAGYVPVLDGIRGLAILLVITYHYFGFLDIFSMGWAGVDLFFVLSGYLITSRLMATRNVSHYFGKFYRNRALRILPVYYFSLLAFYIGFNWLLSPANLPSFQYYNRHWLSFVLFFENWAFIREMPAQDQLLHFWSLAIEEQFYLIWPFIILFLSGKKYFIALLTGAVVLIILSRSWVYFQHTTFKEFPYYFCNTFLRMDGFIIGGGLFLARQKKTGLQSGNLLVVLAALLAAGIFFTNSTQANTFISTVGYTVLALFFAGLINHCLSNKTGVMNRIFSAGWIRFLGKISYGLYIYHWIIYRVMQPRFNDWMKNILGNELSNWVSLVLCLALSLAVSVISYFYFEKYFLKLKRR